MEKRDNGDSHGDKVPLGTIGVPPAGKLYLRHDSAQFNVSSFLDLYARI